MTKNMEILAGMITAAINAEYGNTLPSLKQINEKTNQLRMVLNSAYPISDEELDQLKKHLSANILHKIDHAISLKGADSEHKSWYLLDESDSYYWNKYRKYLKDNKRWGLEIIQRLDETTNGIMDDLGNPKSPEPFQRRGLLLGDVQSGKTATYTAICNKAADSRYKVIIVLAGMMENLRVQTQRRLDQEFVGYDSHYILDKKADSSIKNKVIGVNTIPPVDMSKRISCFTSVTTDFNKGTLNNLGLSLKTLNGTALFVVKKNKTVLNNLYTWLLENNTTPGSDIIDMPLLLIDDESDNASVNTNTEEKDPTAINGAIRNILNCFRQATYLGITATPFANIFIDPDSYGDAVRDLFPKDFLTVLPTPERYIGAKEIFGSGNADDWDNGLLQRKIGKYSNSLIPIYNDEQDAFFKFKHKKELAFDLMDLPESMREAIRYFILVTAISDIKKDKTSHRSMLINTSRYTDVQNRTSELVDNYVSSIKSDLNNYALHDDSMQIKNIAVLFNTWSKYNMDLMSKMSWNEFLKKYLPEAAKRIEVRSVNQKTGAKSLDYEEYRDVGLRVIAVGGNSLSRGITLEGLVVSYFYRNTQMYDTLLQMGRWFGYRENYEDLFKIWMAEEAIDWFGYITDAVSELKAELRVMELQHQTPSDFGLKVRQAPGALMITARNKMRTATNISMPISVSKRIIETPRLIADKEILEDNENLCKKFIGEIHTKYELKREKHVNAWVCKGVPKEYIASLVRSFKSHPWNLNFQPEALYKYIMEDNDSLKNWTVGIPFGSVGEDYSLCEGVDVNPESRKIIRGSEDKKKMLRVGDRHVRVGAGGCSKIGLDEATIKAIRDVKKDPTDSTYLDRDYLPNKREPLLLIHVLKNDNEYDKRVEGDPDYAFALSLGFPDDGKNRTANYMVNVNELKNWADIEDEDDDYEFFS